MTTLGIPAAVLRRATHVADELQTMTSTAVDAHEILTGRAALLGIAPSGRISAGGATQLIRAVDGWCALTLSRRDDVAAVPALTEADEMPGDPWQTVCQWAQERPVESVVERARLLDIPVAALGETAAAAPRVLPLGAAGKPRHASGLLVADLTSMWAGPLCGQLARAGATVIKVESPSRPDGTRAGNRAFFDWMNSGKLSYALDFDRDFGELRTLLSVADIVLEGSRPAALARRGLSPHDLAHRPDGCGSVSAATAHTARTADVRPSVTMLPSLGVWSGGPTTGPHSAVMPSPIRSLGSPARIRYWSPWPVVAGS